ncbi:unnamed protein product [marine sediment metagenome]|uniref:DUF4062 domain-containing protein n=1 Tax=marine sediment metagenome TaxID=412755 RepID=X0VKM2_9ZZZZ
MIITICGSVRLGREVWDKLAEKLTFQGHLIFTVNVWNKHGFLHTDEGKEAKEILDIVHKVKISKSDLVYVLWKDGRIGASTRSEISHAKNLNIPIKFIDVDKFLNSKVKETIE